MFGSRNKRKRIEKKWIVCVCVSEREGDGKERERERERERYGNEDIKKVTGRK